MTPDKATVELVAKALYGEIIGGDWEKAAPFTRDYYRGSLSVAALAALPTPTDASLVEALEIVKEKMNDDIEWDDLNYIHTVVDKALAQHRAGNPWSGIKCAHKGCLECANYTMVMNQPSVCVNCPAYASSCHVHGCVTCDACNWCKATPPEGS